MVQKVTTMRLKVDLQCDKCYKKVKMALCKFPQIRDQVFDEKQNIVTIKVVCCSPEKIRDQLCCKGCGAIKSIEIVEPPKPPEQKPPKPKPTPGPASPETPKHAPKPTCCVSCSEGRPGGPCFEGCGRVPVRTCCLQCSEGRPGGPCFEGHGRVPIRTCCVFCFEGRPGGPFFEGCDGVPNRTCCGPCSEGRTDGPCFEGCRPPPCYEGYFYARPVYDTFGGGRICHVSRCEQHVSEDNPTACTTM